MEHSPNVHYPVKTDINLQNISNTCTYSTHIRTVNHVDPVKTLGITHMKPLFNKFTE